MNVIINGKHYEHITTEITRKAAIEKSSNTGYNIDGSKTSDPMGTRFSYVLVFDSCTKDPEALNRLWNDLIQPRPNGITVTMPYNNSEISFKADVDIIEQKYFTTINNERVWDKIQVEFESMKLNIEV